MTIRHDRVKRVFEEAKSTFGFVPRCYHELAFAPETLERLHDYWRTLNEGPLTGEEILTILAQIALRHENTQQLECWRRHHEARRFRGAYELYLVAPELVSPDLRPVARAVRDYHEHGGKFSDELILDLFRLGKERRWLHHVLFAIGFAEMNSHLSFLNEIDFDDPAAG